VFLFDIVYLSGGKEIMKKHVRNKKNTCNIQVMNNTISRRCFLQAAILVGTTAALGGFLVSCGGGGGDGGGGDSRYRNNFLYSLCYIL